MTVSAPVYLDHHATTPCDPAVLAAMQPCFSQPRGRGREVQALEDAKLAIAGLIGASPEALTLTSGATESNNLVLQGVSHLAQKIGRTEILISALEHESVFRTAQALEIRGLSVKTIPATAEGLITPDAVAELAGAQTLLIAVMAANHEIGTIQPVAAIAEIAHRAGALFHCDATQAAGRIPLDVAQTGADFLCFSAHKIYGPQGIGALYMRPRLPFSLPRLMQGGGRQKLRPGTIPLALAVGFGEACRIAADCRDAEAIRLRELDALMLSELQTALPQIRLNGAWEPRLPGSLNITIPDIDAAALVLDLAEKICFSTGSACREGGDEPSPILRAIGLDDEAIYGSMRFSSGRQTTREDIVFAARTLAEAVCDQAAAL